MIIFFSVIGLYIYCSLTIFVVFICCFVIQLLLFFFLHIFYFVFLACCLFFMGVSVFCIIFVTLGCMILTSMVASILEKLSKVLRS